MLLMFQKTIALHHCEVGEDSPVRAGQAKSGQFWTGTDRLELKVSLFILKNVVRSESISVWAYFHLGLAYHEYLEWMCWKINECNTLSSRCTEYACYKYNWLTRGLQRLKNAFLYLEDNSCFQVRMPLYQTKTIANILEPVAQQVSTIYQNQERIKTIDSFRSANWSSFTRRVRMATPCPTWRPPWWLWVKPWATSSGLWDEDNYTVIFLQSVSKM